MSKAGYTYVSAPFNTLIYEFVRIYDRKLALSKGRGFHMLIIIMCVYTVPMVIEHYMRQEW